MNHNKIVADPILEQAVTQIANLSDQSGRTTLADTANVDTANADTANTDTANADTANADSTTADKTFADLGLRFEIAQAVHNQGYTTPTPIQEEVIPVLLTGQDAIGQAQTGTGKTAAFSLPLLNNMTIGSGHVQTLVLTPTRELAMQVAKAMEGYGRTIGASVLAIYGGDSYTRQLQALRRGVDIVVGTPGRLIDLMKRRALDLSHVGYVVLDEADEMLSMGFIEDIETILSATPDARQTALFSATMPGPIHSLAARYMNHPRSIAIARKQRTAAAIEQRHYLVNESDKLAGLCRLFEMEEIRSALIFTRTRAGSSVLANELSERGYPAEVLNGDMSQAARTGVMSRFRSSRLNVLVATDVAARGLDVDDISHVFNYDLPSDPEVYVHRIGRTGRAGRTGTAISFVTPREQWVLHRTEGYTKQTIPAATFPTVDEITLQRKQKLATKMLVWLNRGRCYDEKEMVTALIEEGHDPVDVAAAALKVAQAAEKHPPLAKMSPVQEQKRGKRDRSDKSGSGKTRYSNRRDSNNRDSGSKGRRRGRNGMTQEEGMVQLNLNVGHRHGIKPGDIVGTIAHHADIPGRAIGRINIEQQQTTIDVQEKFVAQVLAQNYKIRRQPLRIVRA